MNLRTSGETSQGMPEKDEERSESPESEKSDHCEELLDSPSKLHTDDEKLGKIRRRLRADASDH